MHFLKITAFGAITPVVDQVSMILCLLAFRAWFSKVCEHIAISNSKFREP